MLKILKVKFTVILLNSHARTKAVNSVPASMQGSRELQRLINAVA